MLAPAVTAPVVLLYRRTIPGIPVRDEPVEVVTAEIHQRVPGAEESLEMVVPETNVLAASRLVALILTIGVPEIWTSPEEAVTTDHGFVLWKTWTAPELAETIVGVPDIWTRPELALTTTNPELVPLICTRPEEALTTVAVPDI